MKEIPKPTTVTLVVGLVSMMMMMTMSRWPVCVVVASGVMIATASEKVHNYIESCGEGFVWASKDIESRCFQLFEKGLGLYRLATLMT